MGISDGVVIIGVLLVVYFVLKYLTKNSTGRIFVPPKTNPGRTPQAATFSIADLRKHNGVGGAKSYIGLNGSVYDVSGVPIYAEGQNYHVFVGHDATVALAKMKADGTCLDQPLESASLTEGERKVMRDWEQRFREKYQAVGTIALRRKDE